MPDFSEKDLGRILADVEYLKEKDKELVADIKVMKEDLASIKQTLVTVGSMWKVFAMFGSFCAAIGGLIANFLPTFKWQ